MTGSLAPCPVCDGRGWRWVEADGALAPDGEPWTHYAEACAWCDGGCIALPLLPAVAMADTEGRLGAYWTHPADRENRPTRPCLPS